MIPPLPPWKPTAAKAIKWDWRPTPGTPRKPRETLRALAWLLSDLRPFDQTLAEMQFWWGRTKRKRRNTAHAVANRSGLPSTNERFSLEPVTEAVTESALNQSGPAGRTAPGNWCIATLRKPMAHACDYMHSKYQMIVCRRKPARTATTKFFTLQNVREEWESCLLNGSCRLGVDPTVAVLLRLGGMISR